MYWTGSKLLDNVQSQTYFRTMNFCCLQLYCCDICYLWKLFIVRYRYVRYEKFKDRNIEILPRRWRRPPHSARTPGTPCWHLWRWPAPRAPPRRPAPAGGPAWPPGPCSGSACDLRWLTVAHCPTVHCSHPPCSVEAGAWAATGVPSGMCRSEARQPRHRLTSLGADQQVSSVVEAGQVLSEDCAVVSLIVINYPGQMWPPPRARSEGSRRFHIYREGLY